jgi:hypothetical protein
MKKVCASPRPAFTKCCQLSELLRQPSMPNSATALGRQADD